MDGFFILTPGTWEIEMIEEIFNQSTYRLSRHQALF
jgi:hypothetical protein